MSQAFRDVAELCLDEGQQSLVLEKEAGKWSLTGETEGSLKMSYAEEAPAPESEFRARYTLDRAELKAPEEEMGWPEPKRLVIDLDGRDEKLLLAFENNDADALEIVLRVAPRAKLQLAFFWRMQKDQPLYVDLQLGEEAELETLFFPTGEFQTLSPWFVHVLQASQSKLRSLQAVLVSSFRSEWNLRQEGEGVLTEAHFPTYAGNEQKQHMEVELTHAARHSYARLYNHSVVTKMAEVSFYGRDMIERAAGQIDTYQKSKMLLLDPTAKANSRPIMVIDDNDLTAGHASAIGALDPELLYYLQSRGLHREAAEILLTEASLRQDLQAFGFKKFETYLMERLDKRLRGIQA